LCTKVFPSRSPFKKLYHENTFSKFLKVPRKLFSKSFLGGAWGRAPTSPVVGLGQSPNLTFYAPSAMRQAKQTE
jgi:hypothetical protein